MAATLCDEETVRRFVIGGSPIGAMAEAALEVFKLHRRSNLERQPLLSALAWAGYFEDRAYAVRYTDENIDLIEDISGLRLARRLQRWLGRTGGLVVGLVVAACGHWVTPKAERPLSFYYVLRHSTTALLSLVGAAAVALDADRADRIASVLSPFSQLPVWTTLRAVHDLAMDLQQIGREHQADLSARLEVSTRRLEDKSWYPLLKGTSRQLLLTAAHFARGAFAVFRADTACALESIGVLESSGSKMYEMVAAQLRVLMHTFRCELDQAARYRELVEVHAAHVGSAWQVELWEPAALLPWHLLTGDVVATAHAVRQLDELKAQVPSLRLYHQLGGHVLTLLRHEGVWNRVLNDLSNVHRDFHARAPRSFIGWAATAGGIAAAYNRLGRHAEAHALCTQALAHVKDADRDYAMLFLDLELQTALADLGLGQFELARERVETLLERHQASGHALCLGSLYEVGARIAHAAGDLERYREQLMRMWGHFMPTGYPPLIAKCERVAALESRATIRPLAAARETDPITVTER